MGDLLIMQRIGEALSPTAVIPVRAQDEISHLNSILMLGDCVGGRLHLGVGLASLLKSPVLGLKYPFGVFLRKRDSLVELGH